MNNKSKGIDKLQGAERPRANVSIDERGSDKRQLVLSAVSCELIITCYGLWTVTMTTQGLASEKLKKTLM